MKPIDEVITTIKLRKGTQKILKNMKLKPTDSYDDVIRRFTFNG